MALSRTSRILIGFLLLSVAAFVWANLVVGDSVIFLTQAAGGDTISLSPDDVTTSQVAAAGEDSPAIDENAEEETARPEVVPVEIPAAERDIEVLDLPFLIEEPLQPHPAEAATAGEPAAGDGPRRASVNPFSPLVQERAAAAPAPTEAQQAQTVQPRPQVTEVPVPPPPTRVAGSPAPVSAPRAPAPAPVAPDDSSVAALPRALPTGALGGEPELLRRAIGQPAQPDPQAVQDPAAVPETAPEASLPAEEATVQVELPEPEPLDQRVAESSPALPAVRTPLVPAPLEAGVSDLDRFLRDRNVRFIGSVIGPVSVGVFRVIGVDAPIVISLGQPLPETDIILTDLRGQQAEFALDEERQILTLELRR